MRAAEGGARRALLSPSMRRGFTLTKIYRQGPSWEEVKKLLAGVNGTSSVQIRSRCAILLCAVYGLRVGEVCRLRLEDIDWAKRKSLCADLNRGEFQTYPLTTEVGNALLRYLKEARPRCAHREVSLTLRRPYRTCLRWRSFHDDSKATEATRPAAQAIWLACSSSCLCHAPSGPRSDAKGSGRPPGTCVCGSNPNLRQGRPRGTPRSRRLDVRPLVACVEQCQQIAAPFYRIGEIQALRDVGNLGLGGVA